MNLQNIYQDLNIKMVRGDTLEFEHQVYWLWDEDADTAMLKAESKYYTVLAEACLSSMAEHAAILFTSEGFPVLNKCYKHDTTE